MPYMYTCTYIHIQGSWYRPTHEHVAQNDTVRWLKAVTSPQNKQTDSLPRVSGKTGMLWILGTAELCEPAPEWFLTCSCVHRAGCPACKPFLQQGKNNNPHNLLFLLCLKPLLPCPARLPVWPESNCRAEESIRSIWMHTLKPQFVLAALTFFSLIVFPACWCVRSTSGTRTFHLELLQR